MLDTFFFGVFPYIATIVMIIGVIWRYRTNQFSFSSVSSQFLESRQLFWGSVPWHYGIILILLGHLAGVLFPDTVKAVNGIPVRLYIIEFTALALSLSLFVGLIVLISRRSVTPKVRIVTTPMDAVLLAVLLFQVITGILTAVSYRWGSAWYIQTATPYLQSLFTLSPKIGYMASLPVLSKLHAINAFVLVALFPFSRLIHMLSVPLAYLWRPYQIMMWHRRQAQQ